MTYRSIKAYLPSVAAARAVLPAVFPMADTFEAHVSGLHIINGVNYYGGAELYTPSSVYEIQVEAFKEQAEKVRDTFEAVAERFSVPHDWQCDGELHADAIRHLHAMARSTDLLVVAHDGIDDLDLGWDLPSSTAIECGRPVLAIPSGYKANAVGQRVLVAWNGSREATRAVFDSMPFLLKAADVKLLTVEEDGSRQTRGFSPAEEIAVVLARHGVRPEVVVAPASSRGVADTVLAKIRAYDADLLVMGCYGHSRYREFVFGGATHGILTSMTVPTLLSH